ncbi:NAD(P)/FAD-dependent oxidoreductase [bacterium]|nr:NAD(P)/FAD-dependent oxidoreductase [bacterium]
MPIPVAPAPEPLAGSDEEIAHALESANAATLVASLVHVTGDTRRLRGPLRPGRAVLGERSWLRPGDRAALLAEALSALRSLRDRGGALPPPPSPETVHETMSFVAGEDVPADYVPMMLEELALDGRDSRAVPIADGVPAARLAAFRVIVVGAGVSGLLMAIRLADAGVPCLVVEKNGGVGGTWHENVYPGCRVDVANHFYGYSFEPNPDWSEFYSRQPEIRDYLERCADRHGVRPLLRLRTEVESASWDDDAGAWRVVLVGHDGSRETVSANAIVSAVGQLNRPKIPDLPGLDGFAGPVFHSAAWRTDVDLSGRRVGVVGTGASALQLVPEVARIAARLAVFQRSPAWLRPNPLYRRRVSDGKRWLLRHVPFYGRWYRFLCFWPASDGLLPSLEIDPAWAHPERSVNAENDRVREMLTASLRAQVGDDPGLLAKVLPTYPPFVKRMLQDDGAWIDTLKRPNVGLVVDPIVSVERDAIACAGSRHPLDAIVLATGFHATRFLQPMRIEGRGGVRLDEAWGDDPRAHLGITVPGFPNLFLLYGPGTNLAHAGSIVFHSECQVRYVSGCLRLLLAEGARAIECRTEACDEWTRRLDERMSRVVWSHPGADSWYKNSRGRVVTTSPFRLLDYRRWTLAPDPADFRLS